MHEVIRWFFVAWSVSTFLIGGYLGYRYGRRVELKIQNAADIAKQIAGQIKSL